MFVCLPLPRASSARRNGDAHASPRSRTARRRAARRREANLPPLPHCRWRCGAAGAAANCSSGAMRLPKCGPTAPPARNGRAWARSRRTPPRRKRRRQPRPGAAPARTLPWGPGARACHPPPASRRPPASQRPPNSLRPLSLRRRPLRGRRESQQLPRRGSARPRRSRARRGRRDGGRRRHGPGPPPWPPCAAPTALGRRRGPPAARAAPAAPHRPARQPRAP
mmetsp:Transcript_49388/g.164884  ORF Transcript_49388/g.164884 Transcript_49388/m.164884 type:complete len:223 (-) Transcript_49388:2212-2880(-)